ncbi:hypothetical protein FF124_01030 [Martelella lutilitoris]|uniref:Glycosyl hydrolase family 98 putative carbohydrate-binding module domain-containing protein n=1 Tax=Martelella lutilitoris TaxID=2583532 RepID=A0A5C4JW52_9HYPH|nr:hypothetical protein [Martelella lutilitoris]TNB49575.1 hypothetical protein FF124_01030 [Martelella lutilitoris]
MTYAYRFIISLIAAFYLFMLYLLLHPNVSDPYYRYYIAKDVSINPKQLEKIEAIDPDKYYNHRNSDIGYYRGWSNPESEHRWSDGKYAEIKFIVGEKSKFDGEIYIHGIVFDRQRISVYLNNNEIYSGEVFEREGLDLNIRFDKKLLVDGLNTLAFDLPDARRPGGPDQRELAIALEEIAIR